MSKRRPWDILPSLDKTSVSVMGTIFVECRNRAARDAKPMWDSGLTTWSLGAVAFDYTRRAVILGTASGAFPWLSIMDESSHFVFGVHGVPFRFFRGKPDEAASTRHSTACELEQAQLGMTEILAETATESPSVFRFIVSTDPKGFATGCVFARVTEADGELHDVYRIPRLSPSVVAPAFTPIATLTLMQQQQAQTMPKPVFGRSKDAQEQKLDDTKGA